MIYVDTVIWLCIGIHLLVFGWPSVFNGLSPQAVWFGALCALIAGVIIVVRLVLGWIMGAPKTPQTP